MGLRGQREAVIPSTWEVPAALSLVWLLAAMLVLPTAQGIAFWVHGAGFVWPGPESGKCVVGLLTGRPGKGIAPSVGRQPPPAHLVYVTVALFELALAAAMLTILAWCLRIDGRSSQSGMANKREVAAVLGRRSLMRDGKTIRPDLVDRGSR